MKRTFRWFAIFAVSINFVSAQEDDVPGKGVARLSLISGDISVRRGDTGDWVAGAVNGPLVVGDYIQSGAGSRAEIQFDWANLIRLSSDTEIRLPQLEQARYQIQLAQGVVTLSAVRDSDAQLDINTPSVSVRPVRKGRYRIEVREDGSGSVITEVTVRSGEVEIYSPQGSQRLTAGRAIQIRGEFSNPEFQQIAQSPVDDWDRWNERRDQELLRSQAYKNVPQDVYGAEALDDHGSWVESPQYGRVWAPRVAASWAPYQNGRWTWVDYYGWSWVSYDTWGWAPYHYGRWFWNANRWCWWPGQMGVRTFWRPALVAWVGWGGGVGVSLGGWGRVGWVPLAPYERFRPWYGSRGYGGGRQHTTIINNINVTNIYRNSRVNNGVTVVQAQNFGRGNMERVQLGTNDLSRAFSSQGRLPMVPDRASTRMSDRSVSAEIGPRGGTDRRFYSRTPVAETRRVSFDEQRQGIERSTRQAFGGVVGGDRSTASSAIAADRGTGGRVATPSGENGWRRLGDRQSQQANQPGMSGPDNGGARRGGWQRFGETRESALSPRGAVQDSNGSSRSSGMNADGMRTAPSSGRQSFGRSAGGSNDGWAHFGEAPRGQSVNSGSARDGGRVAPQSRMDRMDRSSGSEVRSNPPVIRERGSDRSSGFEGGRMSQPSRGDRGNSGSEGRSASPMSSPGFRRGGNSGMDRQSAPPQMSQPRSSAPSSPRMDGGGSRMGGGSGSSMRGGPSSSGPSMSSGGGRGGSNGGGGGASRGPSSSGGGGGRQGGGGGGRR